MSLAASAHATAAVFCQNPRASPGLPDLSLAVAQNLPALSMTIVS